MLPGKKFTPEDILKIIRRRFWLVVVPAAVVGAATAVVVRFLPDRYTAQAVLLVVAQQVPQSLVPTTDSTRFQDELRTMANTILSRNRLETIIREENLYVDERRTQIMQDVVEDMRADIQVRPQGGADTFTVTYTASSPRAARDVTNKLATLFIEQNSKERSQQAEFTTEFFDSELKDVEQRLRTAESKREDFRRRYMGQLPEELAGNQSALGGVLDQLRTSAEALDRNGNRKRDLEQELAALELAGQAPPDPTFGPLAEGASPVGTTEQQLRQVRATLAVLRGRYTDEHPEVIRFTGIAADLEKKFQAEALARPVSEPAPVRPEEARRLSRMAAIRDELGSIARIMAKEDAEQRRLQANAAALQSRIEGVPALQSEWEELNRNYGTLSGRYNELLAKSENAKMVANMERRQIGEQYKTLDSAVMPSRPVSPDRPLLTFMGLAAGLGLGALLVAFLEYRDTSFKTDQEVSRLLSLPVLAVVPAMQSDEDRVRSRRKQWLVGLGCGTTVASCLALLTYTFIR